MGAVDSEGPGDSPRMRPDQGCLLIPGLGTWVCLRCSESAASHIFLESPLPSHLSLQKALRNNCPWGWEAAPLADWKEHRGLSWSQQCYQGIRNLGFEAKDPFSVPITATPHRTLVKICNLFKPQFSLL